MPKEKKPRNVQLQRFVEEFGSQHFSTDGEKRTCMVCKVDLLGNKRHHVQKHYNSERHKECCAIYVQKLVLTMIERIPNLSAEQSGGITVFRISTMTSLMLHRCRTGSISLQRWWQSPSAAISESDWFLYRAGISRRMTSCTVVSWRLNIAQFNCVLDLIKDDLKKDSSIRYLYSITLDEKLAITLRTVNKSTASDVIQQGKWRLFSPRRAAAASVLLSKGYSRTAQLALRLTHIGITSLTFHCSSVVRHTSDGRSCSFPGTVPTVPVPKKYYVPNNSSEITVTSGDEWESLSRSNERYSTLPLHHRQITPCSSLEHS
ncbi:hypothetical protein ANN_25226 [Periplaneta americana]|uniref:Uncharacterized protein n=1 Tax=Periplaneta americana TaxID=6978 RepID=A0ABQ8S0W4_PERAM|nr:hypothetical protein ANN_25226 [Periplaneta americana]